MVFGIRLSIGMVGEQADNLVAAYQDCHGHCKLPNGVRELVMLSALAALGCGLAAAQGDLPDQPPGRSIAGVFCLLVSVQMPA
jgi:alkylhydroperoxidase/carboxymuconolactone decarboxylase family protein YurZ